MLLPKDVTPAQMIRMVDLLLPDEARLELEPPETILLSFYGRSRTKLFTYEITRDQKPDFSGGSLPALIQDLAGATAARYRGLIDDSDRSLFEKMNEIIDRTGVAVIARHSRDGNYHVLLREVHTVDADWV